MALFRKRPEIEHHDPPCVTPCGGPDNGVQPVEISGTWELGVPISGSEELFETLKRGEISKLLLHGGQIAAWDSSLLIFLRRLDSFCSAGAIDCDFTGLTCGVLGLLDMAAAPLEEPPAPEREQGLMVSAGTLVLSLAAGSADMFSFIGESALSFGRLLIGRTRMRRVDLISAMYQCGPASLGIVGMISLLVGLVMAFIGAAQLRLFGAQVFVADMVAISMLREMGAIMTGIILAGRVGAAYAATIGAMQVNEEIDALHTLGMNPVDFLVLPRLLAMAIMTPLLVLYADLMGILGGAAVGIFMLDLAPMEYYYQTIGAVGNMTNVNIGLIKGLVFGVLVSMAGCRCGIRCGRSSEAVGEAATSAVVAGIVYIVVADAVMAVICQLTSS